MTPAVSGPLSLAHSRAVEQPSVVQALMDCPDLALTLEHMTTHTPWALTMVGEEEWYADNHICIRGYKLLVRDLATCNPHQVKLVRAHFPCVVVGAVTQDPEDPRNAPRLAALGTCTPHVTLLWEKQDGTTETAVYWPNSQAPLNFKAM